MSRLVLLLALCLLQGNGIRPGDHEGEEPINSEQISLSVTRNHFESVSPDVHQNLHHLPKVAESVFAGAETGLVELHVDIDGIVGKHSTNRTKAEKLTNGEMVVLLCSGLCILLLTCVWRCEIWGANSTGQDPDVAVRVCHAFDFISSVELTCSIPTAFDLVRTMGLGAVSSGLLISCVAGASAVGGVLGRSLFDLTDASQLRRIAILSSTMMAVMDILFALVAVFGLLQNHVLEYVVLVSLRSVTGVFLGLAILGYYNMTVYLTPSPDLGDLLARRYTLAGLGNALGPAMSAAMIYALTETAKSSTGGHVPESEQSSLPICLLAVFSGTLALMSALTLPSCFDSGQATGKNEQRTILHTPKENQEPTGPPTEAPLDTRVARFKAEDCRSVFIHCLMFCAERGWTVIGVEVSTAYILEVQFGWRKQAIGLAIGAILLAAIAPQLLLSWIRKQAFVGDVAMARLLTFPTIFGCLFLFPFCGKLCPRFPEGVLFFADAAIYCCAYAMTSIMETFALQASMPDSPYSQENYFPLRTVLVNFGRLLAAPVSRGLIEYIGRESFAAAQLTIVVCSSATVFKVSGLVLTAKGPSASQQEETGT